MPQLKWTMVARGTAVMNESELATLILRLLSHMAKIFPSRDVDGAIIRQFICYFKTDVQMPLTNIHL